MDILTDYCIEHDSIVKQIKGDTGTDTSLKDRDLLNSIGTAASNIQLYDITISTHMDSQKQVKKTSSQWHEYEKAIWETERLKKKEESIMTSLQQQWDKHAGPFIRSLDNIITSLHVKRQRYHGGVFVGNDCVRLLDGREQLSAVLKPQQFYSQDGTSHVIGSNEQSQLIFGLLDRLYHLHKLYSAARPLCCHEVSDLQTKAYEFGNWYPFNFPNQTITPKMHIMIYHMPELAQLYHTVGMFCEQAGEALHPLCNKLGRQYVYLSSDVKRMQAMLNRCIRLHDPRVLQHVPTRKTRSNKK